MHRYKLHVIYYPGSEYWNMQHHREQP